MHPDQQGSTVYCSKSNIHVTWTSLYHLNTSVNTTKKCFIVKIRLFFVPIVEACPETHRQFGISHLHMVWSDLIWHGRGLLGHC
jgi:hypothetical protein